MHRSRPAVAPAAWLAFCVAAITACAGGPSADGVPTRPAGSGYASPRIDGSGAPGAELPAGFPVIAGAVPEQLLPSDDPAIIARWSSDQVGPIAYDYYIDALPAAGYPTTGLFPGGAVAIIGFRTPSGERWELALTLQGTGTRIEVRLAQP